VCDASVWKALPSCAGQTLCDTRPGPTQGSCQEPVPVCIGKNPGDTFCDGGDAVECGPDLVTSTSTTCPYVCVDGGCVGECLPGATDCAQSTPRTCEATGAWLEGAVCAYVCDAGACGGSCVPGARQCNGATPEECDDAGARQSESAFGVWGGHYARLHAPGCVAQVGRKRQGRERAARVAPKSAHEWRRWRRVERRMNRQDATTQKSRVNPTLAAEDLTA
jgi:hypothetical protein